MLYKYHPPTMISRSTVKSMPQLDFREALSTPEEKHFSPVPAPPVPAAIPAPRKFDFLARGFRLTRSTWANIIFVTIASAGGLFCAFYFFNGAEVLRAAASWPNEFLYPRPSSMDVINSAVQPNPVDTFSDTTASNSDNNSSSAAKRPFDQKVWPTDLSQPPIVTSPLTAPGVFTDTGIVLVPSGPGSTIFSTIGSTIEGLNLLPPGGDALFQSLYQTAVSTTTSTVKTAKKTVRSTLSSTRRKIVSSTGQKLTSGVQSSASGASSMVRTTTQNMQQTTMTQTQIGGINTIQAPNQTMIGGGLSGVGGTAGGTVGGTIGGVTGTGGLGSLGSGLGGLGGLGGHH